VELHGFFLHVADIERIVDSFLCCSNLKRVSFSNNNIQDKGAAELCRLLIDDDAYKCQIENLTIYNNNVTCVGAMQIAEAL